MPAPDLSVVLPVYNEEESLAPLCAELREVLDGGGLDYEIVFVDDGSRDRSAEIIRGLRERSPRVRLIRFKANAGETAALDAGFKAARGRWVVSMDADLQNDPHDIPHLLSYLDRWDAVTGWRARRGDGDSLVRRVSSRIANRIRNVVTGEDIQDSGCTFRAFRRECLKNLVLYRGFHRFIPQLLRMQGYRVVEVAIGHRPRRFGQSKYGVMNRAAVAFADLLVVRWMQDRLLRYEVAEDLGGDSCGSSLAPWPFSSSGFGRWGEQHLRVLRELGAEVWVADVSPARRAWAEGQGVPPSQVVSDYREGLPHVAAVDVVTPAGSHPEIAAASLAARRHCFVEKPLSLTTADGRTLAAVARTAATVLQVGHIFRFHPVTATVRTALRGGQIGAVRYATGRFSGFKRPRSDAGITSTDAVHYFDLFAHLLARDATSAMALQRDYLGRGCDDMSVTIVRYGEVPVVVEASYFAPGTHRECMIVGDVGSLLADFGAGTVTLHAQEFARNGEQWEAIDRGAKALPVAGGEPLKLELAAFLAACAGHGPNLVGVEAGVHAVAIVEAAGRSAALGRAVSLDEIA